MPIEEFRKEAKTYQRRWQHFNIWNINHLHWIYSCHIGSCEHKKKAKLPDKKATAAVAQPLQTVSLTFVA